MSLLPCTQERAQQHKAKQSVYLNLTACVCVCEFCFVLCSSVLNTKSEKAQRFKYDMVSFLNQKKIKNKKRVLTRHLCVLSIPRPMHQLCTRMSHKVRKGFDAYSQDLQQAAKKNHQRKKHSSDLEIFQLTQARKTLYMFKMFL